MVTMSKESIFNGAWCPSITPFTQQGKIDTIALEKHIQRISDCNTNVILLMGSIGEFTAMNLEERIDLIRMARKMTDTTMVANISANCVSDIKRLADEAYTCGFDAVMLLPHYYFSQTESQLIEYYSSMNEFLKGYWFAYNFPARTGCDLGADIICALAKEIPRFIGVKDTVDTLSHTRMIIQKVRQVRSDFLTFSGFDEYFIPNLLSGGAGIVSGLNNIVPELFVDAITSYAKGDLSQLEEIQRSIGKYSSIYSIGNDFVTSIKTVVARKYGYMLPASRSYGGALTKSELNKLDQLFDI